MERFNKRIEEFAFNETYKESVWKLSCFIGVKTDTALSVLTEVDDFKRFSATRRFVFYIGLHPERIREVMIGTI